MRGRTVNEAPPLRRGELAYYHSLTGRVKVKVRRVRQDVDYPQRVGAVVVVTQRSGYWFKRGEVIGTTPHWLTTRDGLPFNGWVLDRSEGVTA